MISAGPAETLTPRPEPSGGLTTVGAVIVLVVITGVGAAVDVVLSDDLGWGIGASYVLAALAALTWVRRGALLAAVLAGPLVFAVVVVAGVLATGGGDGLTKTGLGVATELALLAPGLWIGTALAVVVALLRRRR